MGGAILLLNSKLVIKEFAVVLFANNNATYGGALYIDRTSSMLIFSPSNLLFINNTASLKGGAIYVQTGVPSPYMQSQCFFQFQAAINLSVVMHFEGNYAGEAGSVLYGGNIDSCTLDCTSIPHQYHDRCMNSSGAIFDMITDIIQYGNSTLASDPTTLCYCNESHVIKCSDKNYTEQLYKRYPGEIFSKSLIARGQRGGIVPDIVYTWYYENGIIINSAFRTAKYCHAYHIPYKKQNANNIIYMAPDTKFNNIFDIMESFSFNLTLLLVPCPIGFSIDNTSLHVIVMNILKTTA